MLTAARVRGHVVSRGWLLPSLAAAADAVAFFIVAPPVNDLYAARAHESAAAHGVGWTYWFAWFGGGATPGGYSLVTPWLSELIGSVALGAVATVAITPLTWVALRSAPQRAAAAWVATGFAAASLWSGRIPFAAGAAVAIGALIALDRRRPVPAAALAVLATAMSPVCGAFLGMGLLAVFVCVPAQRRRCLAIGIVLALALGVLLLAFGSPGPQPFKGTLALTAIGCACAVLVVRPPPALAVLVAITIVLCPVLVAVPNAVGSNLARLPLYVLPVVAVAYARGLVSIPLLRLVPVVSLVAVLPAAYFAGKQATDDLVSASKPIAAVSYYDSLRAELARAGPTNCRVEVLDGVSHVAAYLLIDDVMLARGWETQADHAYDKTVLAADLDAARYRRWLDENAVCLVAVPSDQSVHGPEVTLLRHARPAYLSPVFHDERWTLLRVADAVPIVSAPARVARYTQAALTVNVPCTCTLPVRVRWSRYLTAGSGTLRDDGSGWSMLTVPRPGRYELRGSLLHGLFGG